MATVGNTIQTFKSIYEYMSAPGKTAKLGTAHSNIQTAQSCTSLVGIDHTYALVSTLLSQRINPPCQHFCS